MMIENLLEVSAGLAIFSVTRSPAFCSIFVASVRVLPLVVSPLIASSLSPICIAPVLKEIIIRHYVFLTQFWNLFTSKV